MDDTKGETPAEGRDFENKAQARVQALVTATEIFERLIVTASDTVGFPTPNTSRPAIEQGVRLTKEFLKISNQQVRILVVELVSAIATIDN